MPEGKPGDGKSSPFGNGDGATASGAASGAHNFLTDPKSGAPAGGGKDFTQGQRPQQQGQGCNPETIPDGGKVLKADPGAASTKVSPVQTPTAPRKPFKV